MHDSAREEREKGAGRQAGRLLAGGNPSIDDFLKGSSDVEAVEEREEGEKGSPALARLHLARVINQAILTLAGPGVGVAEAIVVAVGVRVGGWQGQGVACWVAELAKVIKLYS